METYRGKLFAKPIAVCCVVQAMSEIERNTTLRNILLKAAKDKTRVRLIGPPNVILSEGFVDFVGNGIVGMKHQIKEEADEFILTCNIIKIQLIGDSTQTY